MWSIQSTQHLCGGDCSPCKAPVTAKESRMKSSGADSGEEDGEHRAFTRLGPDRERAAVVAHAAEYGREPEAVTGGLRGEKGVEDVFHRGRVHAAAFVPDFQADVRG